MASAQKVIKLRVAAFAFAFLLSLIGAGVFGYLEASMRWSAGDGMTNAVFTVDTLRSLRAGDVDAAARKLESTLDGSILESRAAVDGFFGFPFSRLLGVSPPPSKLMDSVREYRMQHPSDGSEMTRKFVSDTLELHSRNRAEQD